MKRLRGNFSAECVGKSQAQTVDLDLHSVGVSNGGQSPETL